MGVRVAYGSKGNIRSAIENGTIPPDSIIITKDKTDSELLFYDADKNLKDVSERMRFETLSEAESYARQYSCHGYLFVVHNGSDWQPYIVQDDNSLSPFGGGSVEITDITIIDGGNASGT